jgi:hypothetical protein
MRPRHTGKATAPRQQTGSAPGTDATHVDALYGLDPVFEPGADRRQRPLEAAVEIECPHCWQTYASSVDLTLGPQTWIEDCQHCCHPIAVEVEVIDDGRGARVSAGRLDA